MVFPPLAMPEHLLVVRANIRTNREPESTGNRGCGAIFAVQYDDKHMIVLYFI
jgi:hypothetical protein